MFTASRMGRVHLLYIADHTRAGVIVGASYKIKVARHASTNSGYFSTSRVDNVIWVLARA